MGEVCRDALRVGCTSWTLCCGRAIKLVFHGAKVSSDAGLFPRRDLDEATTCPTDLSPESFLAVVVRRACESGILASPFRLRSSSSGHTATLTTPPSQS